MKKVYLLMFSTDKHLAILKINNYYHLCAKKLVAKGARKSKAEQLQQQIFYTEVCTTRKATNKDFLKKSSHLNR